MPQAQTGHSPALKSIPKICRINGDDNRTIVYRNLGNNHAYPFIWGDTYTVVSGTTEAVISDDAAVETHIKFHGYDLADHGNVIAQPLQDMGTVNWWIEKDTSNKTVKIKVDTDPDPDDFKFDVQIMLGDPADVELLYCRGNKGVTPSLP